MWIFARIWSLFASHYRWSERTNDWPKQCSWNSSWTRMNDQKMKRDDVCWWSDLFGGVIEQQSLKGLIRVFHQDQFFHFIVIGEMRGSLRRGSRSGNKKNRCLRPADASLFMTEWRSTVFFYMVEVRGIEPLSRNGSTYGSLQLISWLNNPAVCAWANICRMCF